MPRISLSHVTHINESCRTYEWVKSHIWTSHVTHINETCHTYQWVMSPISMSYVTHINQTYPTHLQRELNGRYACIREACCDMGLLSSRRWTACARHVTHVNGSCHTYEYVMSHKGISHVTRVNVSCHKRSILRHKMCVSSCHLTACGSRIKYITESCHTVQWVISHMKNVKRMNEPCMNVSRHVYEWVMSHTSPSHVIQFNESFHTFEKCQTYEWAMYECVMPHVW